MEGGGAGGQGEGTMRNPKQNPPEPVLPQAAGTHKHIFSTVVEAILALTRLKSTFAFTLNPKP